MLKKIAYAALLVALLTVSIPTVAGTHDAPPSPFQILASWWQGMTSMFDAVGPEHEPLGSPNEIGPQNEPIGSYHKIGPEHEPIGQPHNGTDEIGPEHEPIGQPLDGTGEIGPQHEPIG